MRLVCFSCRLSDGHFIPQEENLRYRQEGSHYYPETLRRFSCLSCGHCLAPSNIV